MGKDKVFLCWTLNSGTTFYRMMNYIKHSRKKIDFGMSKWSTDIQGVAEWEYRITDPQVGADLHALIGGCDVAVSQKFHSIGGLALIDAYKHQFPKKPWVSEFDDNVFAVNPSSAAYDNYFPGSELESIALEQITLSNALIVSTEALRQTYEGVNPNIWVVPNAIDFEIWDGLKDTVRRSDKIRIGWAGGGAHMDDLEFIYPAVDKIRKKFSNVEFVFLGGFPECYKNTRRMKAFRKWVPIDKYPQELKNLNLDIALAPLKDNEFNRGKSNLRWLEYSALKIPTIASNVEPFKSIKNGETGFLVTEPDEWADAMAELIDNESMRGKIGVNAYKEVKEKHNIVEASKIYVNTIKSIICGKSNISKRAVIGALANGGF